MARALGLCILACLSALPANSFCTGFEAQMSDTEVAGTLMMQVMATGSDECCTMCGGKIGCEGYTFHLYQCYFMKDISGAQHKAGALARVKGSPCKGFEAEMVDTETVGTLVATVWSPDSAGCCALCDTINCEGYTFNRYQQCSLMKNLTGTQRKVGAFARVKEGSSCKGFEAEMADMEMVATLVAKVWSPDSAGCCALCDGAEGCEGYTFHLDQCYLMKDLIGTQRKEGAFARVKEGAWARAKGSSSTCMGFEAEMPDTDMAGTLVAKVWSPNSARCCALCDEAEGCEGYSFHLDQCYLKKDMNNPWSNFYKLGVSSRVKNQGRRLEGFSKPKAAGFLVWA